MSMRGRLAVFFSCVWVAAWLFMYWQEIPVRSYEYPAHFRPPTGHFDFQEYVPSTQVPVPLQNGDLAVGLAPIPFLWGLVWVIKGINRTGR